MENNGKCPVMHGDHARGTVANQHWWPNQLNLKMLHQNPPQADPMGGEFNYAEAFKSLDLDALNVVFDQILYGAAQRIPRTALGAGRKLDSLASRI